MFKSTALIISAPLIFSPNIERFEQPKPVFEIKGDYTLEGMKYLKKMEPYKVKDINDIMFDIIIKEYEEKLHE